MAILKPVAWLGDSLVQVRQFADVPRHDLGYQLERVQAGKEPKDWKSMPSIGLGVSEIRVRDSSGIYRLIYVARFSESIYVLHALQKKDQKTPTPDIELARKRFRELVQERKRK